MEKRVKTALQCIIAGLMALLLCSQFSLVNAATTYEYKEKDKTAEQKKYLARLAKDKKKVELAVASTKVLIDKSQNKPYLPELYLRLAELYIEKSRIVYFLRKGEQKEKLSELEQFESNMLKNQAIEIYQRILTHFPAFQNKDKVHFFMAHEYRELGKIDDMVQQYRTIIKEHGQSSYVPESFLLLGDYFFGEGDIDQAKQHYESVLPYTDSQAVAIARYKLAWCHINNADYPSAIALFEKAVSSKLPGKNLDVDTYRRVDIKLESLIDMAYCYPESYKKSSPEEALAYFQKYSWSRQGFTIALEKLAYRYFIKKKWKMAAALYRKLADLRQDSDKLLEYNRNIFESIQALGNFDDADKDVALIIKALKKQKYSVHVDDAEKQKNIKDFELYARDIVTHLHEKARTVKSFGDFKRAADTYQLYLAFFEESPVYDQMRANYAEALFAAKQYGDAGKQYEKLAQETVVGLKDRQETLYSAVTSYFHALKNKKDLNYYHTTYAREGLKTTGRLYAEEFPFSDHTKDVLFNVAWVSHDAGKYEQAINEFTSFVNRYPDTKESEAAVHLILDAYHIREDFEGMARFGQHIISHPQIHDSKLKADVSQIVANAESRLVSSLTVAAVDDWEKGKTGLMQVAEKSKSSAMGEQALNALIVSAQDKGDLEAMFMAGANLIRQFPDSAHLEETLALLINSALKIGQYRMLADFMEQFTDTMPKHANTAEFLNQAGNIRQRLGQHTQANHDFNRYLTMSTKKNSDRDSVIFGMAVNARQRKSYQDAIAILQTNYNSLSTTGRIRADALMANLLFQQKEYKGAYHYHKKAIKAYKPALGKKDPQMNDAIAEMVYGDVMRASKKYMALSLTGKIDNTIVAEKTKLLAKLEKDFGRVMEYKSSEWALKACFEMAVLNKEFARFLREAPLPDLSSAEKQQYTSLIDKKAAAYISKAEKYLQTGIELAHKWEVCRPDLADYYHPQQRLSGSGSGFLNFAGKGTRIMEIAADGLKDEGFGNIYSGLLQKPDDIKLLLELSEHYILKGDYAQAALVTGSALQKVQGKKNSLTANLHNTMGVIHLYLGEDQQARERFKNALKIESGHTAARINNPSIH